MTTRSTSRAAAVLLTACALLILTLVPTPTPAGAQQASDVPGLVVIESTQSFEQTWSSLIAALDANSNIRTIAQIDHAAAATSADLVLENSRVVFFGNPALGTPLMQASRTTGVDLPQKMHVFQDGDRVFVTYNAASYLSARHATGPVSQLVTIEGALAGLANAAANSEGVVVTPSSGVAANAGLVTTASANDFETTWANLIAAIDGSPASVAFTVDHAANASGALLPTRLVVFGNPAIGTPIMASSATAGIDLPLKMLVYEDDAGVTHVVSTSPSFVQSRHGVGSVATIGGATDAIANFTAAATTATTVPATTATPDTGDEPAADEVLGVTELALTGADPGAALLATFLLGLGAMFVVAARRVDVML